MKTIYEKITGSEEPMSVRSVMEDSIAKALEAIPQNSASGAILNNAVDNHVYRLSSFNFMTNLNLADLIIKESGVLKYKGEYARVAIPTLLECFMEHILKRYNTIVFTHIGSWVRMVHFKNLCVWGEGDNKHEDSFFTLLDVFKDENVFASTYKESLAAFELVLNSEVALRDILQNRNCNKDGMVVPMVFYIDPFFLTFTLFH